MHFGKHGVDNVVFKNFEEKNDLGRFGVENVF